MKPSLNNLKIFLHHVLCLLWEIFNFPDICWKSTREGCRQARSFLEDVRLNCLTQVLGKPTWGHTYTPHGPAKHKAFTVFGGVIINGSLGCEDPEIVDFKIRKRMRKTSSRLQTVDFRRKEISVSSDY